MDNSEAFSIISLNTQTYLSVKTITDTIFKIYIVLLFKSVFLNCMCKSSPFAFGHVSTHIISTMNNKPFQMYLSTKIKEMFPGHFGRHLF